MTRRRITHCALLVVPVFACGVAARGDDHTWTGAVSDSYSEGGNWTPTEPPADGDVIYVIDPSPNDTCIVDTAGNVSLLGMELEGVSPTQMILFVRDRIMTVTYRPCGIFDYGVLEADKNFTSTFKMDLGGELWIEIARNVTDTVTVYFQIRSDVVVDGLTTMHLNDHTTGVFKIDNLYVDATLGSANRGIKFDAVGSTATVLDLLQLTSGPEHG